MATKSQEEAGDCFIISAAGFEWPQLQSDRLFVPKSYPDLWLECQKNFDVGVQGIFLIGTPGIGKSCFLDYCLHQCMQDGKRVLYFLGPSRQALVFQNSALVEQHKLQDALDWELADNKADIILFDPHESTVQQNDIHISHFREKPFIVAMAPDRENCKKLRKDTRKKARLYMGTLSVAQAELMRSTCYPDVPSGLLRKRYASFGGVVRHLFEPAHQQVDDATWEVEQNMRSALHDIAENPRRVDGGELASQYQHLWSLYHLEPTITEGLTDYTTYTIEPCSDHARTRVRDMLLLHRTVQELWELFVNTPERHTTLREIRYEAYAHKKMLEQGLNTTAVSDDGIEIVVEIPALLPKTSLAHPHDLDASFSETIARAMTEGGYLLLPSLSNCPDSLYVPSRSKPHHTLLLLHMRAAAGRSSKPFSGAVPSTLYIEALGYFVFVVPDESKFLTKKKLGCSSAESSSSAGPIHMRRYRVVLKE